MFARTLVDRLILPPEWERLRPEQLAELAEDASPLAAREWIVELVRGRRRVAAEAGLLEDRAAIEHEYGEARFEATDAELSRAADDCIASMLADLVGDDDAWWFEAVEAACAADPVVASLRAELRRVSARAVSPEETDWLRWAADARRSPEVGRLYRRIWEAEREVVASGIPSAVSPESWSRIRPHVPAEQLVRLEALRDGLHLERRRRVERLESMLAEDDVVLAGIVWPDPPPAPAPDADRRYLWDSPWQDGGFVRSDGGIDWRLRHRVRLDAGQAANYVASETRGQIIDRRELVRRLTKGIELEHAPPITRADLDEAIGDLVQGSPLNPKRRVYGAITRLTWLEEMDSERTAIEGTTLRARIVPPGEAEANVVDVCSAMGAEWVDRPLQVPRYKSWAVIAPCRTLRHVERDDEGIRTIVEYTPHGYDQTAPFSERGTMLVYGRDEAIAADCALRFGGEWVDLSDGVWPIPKFARIIDASSLRAAGLVMHGLTGADDPLVASERLGQIIDSGGLHSIATRRQRRVSNVSLSPLGDIGSGVDWGVPCKIGVKPSYGKFAYFVMRPEILERRDVWFSDRDFGGGASRYEHYNEYARRIGHTHFWRPPPLAARVAHLAEGCAGDDNEVWFADRIELSEMRAVYLSTAPELDEVADRLAATMDVVRFRNERDLHERLSRHCEADRREDPIPTVAH